ncbi:hypothetical protein BpHYR1_027788 [Brachionus plicatilis]|uniref:Uncharacterized protein n=1 Tax=Brachionus plicatilis TaxID=10195 RepID=A0A3M7RUC1_BRAPC|nr:hypothetical protein BpHYR1_027788 [Brachionus plicatilis]
MKLVAEFVAEVESELASLRNTDDESFRCSSKESRSQSSRMAAGFGKLVSVSSSLTKSKLLNDFDQYSKLLKIEFESSEAFEHDDVWDEVMLVVEQRLLSLISLTLVVYKWDYLKHFDVSYSLDIDFKRFTLLLRYLEFTIFGVKYGNLKKAFFVYKLFAALSQASLNVDPFGMNFTFISFPRSKLIFFAFKNVT